MNKELENLEHIKDVLISMNFAFDDITANCFNNVENALTPPTSEEVCEALSEELNVIIVYKDKEFYYDWKFNGTSGISLIVGYYENVIKFYDHCLSPQSLSFIAKFYEGGEE